MTGGLLRYCSSLHMQEVRFPHLAGGAGTDASCAQPLLQRQPRRVCRSRQTTPDWGGRDTVGAEQQRPSAGPWQAQQFNKPALSNLQLSPCCLVPGPCSKALAIIWCLGQSVNSKERGHLHISRGNECWRTQDSREGEAAINLSQETPLHAPAGWGLPRCPRARCAQAVRQRCSRETTCQWSWCNLHGT